MDGSPSHTIGYQLSGESPPTNLGVRGFGELTISMAECEGLALITFGKMEK
jgi:hypothetical protein